MKIKNYEEIKANEYISYAQELIISLDKIEKFLLSIGISDENIYYNNKINNFVVNDVNLLMYKDLHLCKTKDMFYFYIIFNRKRIRYCNFIKNEFIKYILGDIGFKYEEYPEIKNIDINNKNNVTDFAKKIAKELLIKDILD
jgi:hypothetical protein